MPVKPSGTPSDQSAVPGLVQHAMAELARLDAAGRARHLVPTARQGGTMAPIVWRDGRRLVSFSCNDYLNLSCHPAVIAATIQAVERYGAGAGASRLVSGEHPLLGALEARIAAFKGTAAACVFGSGFLANLGILAAITGPGDVILLDALSHACLFAGARASGARHARFRHNDPGDLEAKLVAQRPRARHLVVVTERVFSMDGDLAPLDAIARLAMAHDAWLLVDDAHGLCVLAPDPAPVSLAMGTLSKVLGSYGGYVCADAAVVRLLHHRAPSLVYSTALPPAQAAAALAALELIAADPGRSARPLQLARRFAAAVGLPVPQSQIVPVVLGTERAALAASARLEAAGFLAVAIRPPTVPDGTARLRFAFSAGHQEAEIDAVAALVRTL